MMGPGKKRVEMQFIPKPTSSSERTCALFLYFIRVREEYHVDLSFRAKEPATACRGRCRTKKEPDTFDSRLQRHCESLVT